MAAGVDLYTRGNRVPFSGKVSRWRWMENVETKLTTWAEIALIDGGQPCLMLLRSDDFPWPN